MKALALLLALAGCHAAPTPIPSKRRERVADFSEDQVERAAALALGGPLAAGRAAELARGLRDGSVTLDAVIEEIVRDPRAASTTAPRLYLDVQMRRPLLWQGDGFILHADADPKDPTHRPLLHLDKPCTRNDAEPVHPWWDLDSTVLVCKDAYRPKTFHLDSQRVCMSRDVSANKNEGCGCGPNLVMCLRDDAQMDELALALLAESRDTIALAAAEDRPLDWIFTTNATVRRPLAQFQNERQLFLAGAPVDLADLRSWPVGGKLAPRVELVRGEHAGILTTPQLTYLNEGTRLRQVNYDELMWCAQTRGVHTDVESVLALGHGNFRDGDSWEHLAHLPFCTSCHARLDYGQQFFLGFPAGVDAYLFLADRVAPGVGKLYLKDANDYRGEAPLTPTGFAELAIAQPEFRQCMVRRVGEHVLGPQLDKEANVALLRAFDEGHHAFRPILRAALRIYFQRQSPSPPPSRDTSTPSSGDVTLGPRGRALVDHYCVACHLEGPYSLDRPSLPREVAIRALAQVAMRTMPKSSAPEMSVRDVRELVDSFIDATWGSETDRDAARRYFEGVTLGAGVTLPMTLSALVDDAAGTSAKGPPWDDLESRVRRKDMRYSPALMIMQAVEAVSACRSRGLKDAALDECMMRATDPRLGLDRSLAP